MGYSYHGAEKQADMKLMMERKKEEFKMLEEIIRGLTEDVFQDGLTEEQMFLINYYGLDKKKITQKNFDISNIEQVLDIKSKIPEEQLETQRYNELIDMYSAVEEFDEEEINKYNDLFHGDIKDWYDYTDDFDQDPLIVKKMRNLQILNRLAHKYETLLKNMLSIKNPEIYEDNIKEEIKRIEYNIKEMFSPVKSKSEKATKILLRIFDKESVDYWKANKAIRYCVNAMNWMFEQKNKYVIEVLKDLQNTNGKYNYGVLQDGLIFDVPRYGQFGIHLGKNSTAKIEKLKQLYGVKDYEGEHLGNVYILSKADPELLKDVNYEELSDTEKQRYRIVYQEPKQSSSIFKDFELPEQLTWEEQKTLFSKLKYMRENGVDVDTKEYQDIRQKLIIHNMRMVLWAAHIKYRKNLRSLNIERDDLEQMALESLINAVDDYDVSQEYRFSTYAIRRVFWDIKRRWMEEVNNNDATRRNWMKLNRFEEEMLRSANRLPTDEEIKKFLSLSDKGLKSLKNYINYHKRESIDKLNKKSKELSMDYLPNDERIEEIENNPILNGIYVDEYEPIPLKEERKPDVAVEQEIFKKDLKKALDFERLSQTEREVLMLRTGLKDGKVWTIQEVRTIF